MLETKPKVGDIIRYQRPDSSQFGVWKIVSVKRGSLYGDLISADPENSWKTYNQQLAEWRDPNWSIDFSQWVKNTRRDQC